MKHFWLLVLFVLIWVPNVEAQSSVARFVLVRADNGSTLVDPLLDGATISLASLGTKQLSIRAITNPSKVKKVEFSFSAASKIFIDSAPPYAMLGDDGGNYFPWPATAGSYSLTATPYDLETVAKGTSSTIKFTVTDATSPQSSPTITATPSPTTTPKPTATATVTPKPTATPVVPTSTTPMPTPTLITDSRELAVFPGASGHGTKTVAGSGRHLSTPFTTIFRVTNLNDSGAGSLRSCAEASSPRTCIFEVSGIIRLLTAIRIKNPYLTIAGQTAPAPGIMLAQAGIRIETNDVLIQHLQVRVGDGAEGPEAGSRDGIAITATSKAVFNVVLDHLSVSWAVDENLSTWYPNVNDVTVSNSVISEALYRSIHPDGAHSMGFLVGDYSQRISIHHNLFAHNQDRNPRLKHGTSVEFISNVVYNWGGGSSGWNQANLSDTEKTKIPTLLTFIGNFYKPGPQSLKSPSVYASSPAPGSRVYTLSNIGPNRLSDSGSEWSLSGLSESVHRASAPPFPLSDIVPHAANETFPVVLANAGARPRENNSVDARVKQEVREGRGVLKDCVSACANNAGGFPVLSQNFRPLSPPANAFADDDRDGYTNLEEWLQGFSAAVE